MGEWGTMPFGWYVGAGTLFAALLGAVYGFGQWKGKVDADRASFKQALSEIQKDIKRILERLPLPSTLISASPLRLSELGKRIPAHLDAPAIVEDLAVNTRSHVSGMEPYEIQEFCFNYARNQYKPPVDIKKLFLQSAYGNGISLEQVMDVVAIELQDRLLAKHE